MGPPSQIPTQMRQPACRQARTRRLRPRQTAYLGEVPRLGCLAASSSFPLELTFVPQLCARVASWRPRPSTALPALPAGAVFPSRRLPSPSSAARHPSHNVSTSAHTTIPCPLQDSACMVCQNGGALEQEQPSSCDIAGKPTSESRPAPASRPGGSSFVNAVRKKKRRLSGGRTRGSLGAL